MKIKFTGVPGEDVDPITMYGMEFPKGKWVEVNNTLAKNKLSKHPFFEAKGDDVVEDVEVKRDTKAEEAQAKINQAADDAVEATRSNELDSALEYQRREEQEDAPAAPLDHTPASAEEYQALEEANQVPSPVVPVAEEAPVRRGPGRPKAS